MGPHRRVLSEYRIDHSAPPERGFAVSAEDFAVLSGVFAKARAEWDWRTSTSTSSGSSRRLGTWVSSISAAFQGVILS